jgi:acyl-coenzyme A synthetase/AMP-(fatty) acid ligase
VGYAELAPEKLLTLGFDAPELTEQAWRVHWEEWAGPAAEELCVNALPPVVDFSTSGTTGPSRRWRRSRENVWLEAGMLAGLVAPERPETVVSFAPPAHLFGALTSVLVPAHLGVDVWYRSTFYGAMPEVGHRRVVVVATPWIFQLLLQHLAWVRGLAHVTVLYSGAMLPATAGEFLRQAGADRAAVVEVLGSTEAGGVAYRRWREGEPPDWTLFPDVSFAHPEVSFAHPERPEGTEEVPLVVRGPRLAFRPGEPPLDSWTADDRIQVLGERSFRLTGRAGRLVKVNGRRINLDQAESAMRAELDCADLALVPVTDDVIGEHVELLVVLRPGTALSGIGLAEAFRHAGLRPKKVSAVPAIERSALGKLRHTQGVTA